MSGALNMLGMARRAGAVQIGEEASMQAVLDHKARLILIAADAGESGANRMQRLESGKVPVLTVSDTKADLGGALGFANCAACAVTDLGLASAIVKKLAEEDPRAAEISAVLTARSAKAQRRKADTRKLGKKSKRKKS